MLSVFGAALSDLLLSTRLPIVTPSDSGDDPLQVRSLGHTFSVSGKEDSSNRKPLATFLRVEVCALFGLCAPLELPLSFFLLAGPFFSAFSFGGLERTFLLPAMEVFAAVVVEVDFGRDCDVIELESFSTFTASLSWWVVEAISSLSSLMS